MPAKFPIEPLPAERQVERAMDLLELYGATKPDLWRAIDQVVMKRNDKIAKLEMQIKILEAKNDTR